MIPRVVASESGTAQTSGLVHWGCRTGNNLQRRSGTAWESRPKRVRVPYIWSKQRVSILSTTRHANRVGNWGVHPPRLNTLDDR